MKRTKWLAGTFAFGLAALFVATSQTGVSLAQPRLQDPSGSRKPACGCYVCGTLDFVEFADKAADCAGILAEDVCGRYLGANNISPEARRSFCNLMLSKGCRTGVCDSPKGKNCGDSTPGRGSLYASTLGGRIYSEPSTNSTVVDSPPNGTRLRYTNTTTVNGETWYYIQAPGRPNGWMPASQLSCTRPIPPPTPKRTIDPKDASVFSGRAALASGARG